MSTPPAPPTDIAEAQAFLKHEFAEDLVPGAQPAIDFDTIPIGSVVFEAEYAAYCNGCSQARATCRTALQAKVLSTHDCYTKFFAAIMVEKARMWTVFDQYGLKFEKQGHMTSLENSAQHTVLENQYDKLCALKTGDIQEFGEYTAVDLSWGGTHKTVVLGTQNPTSLGEEYQTRVVDFFDSNRVKLVKFGSKSVAFMSFGGTDEADSILYVARTNTYNDTMTLALTAWLHVIQPYGLPLNTILPWANNGEPLERPCKKPIEMCDKLLNQKWFVPVYRSPLTESE